MAVGRVVCGVMKMTATKHDYDHLNEANELRIAAKSALSREKIAPSLDKALDKENPSSGGVAPGISIRNGPVEEMNVGKPRANGAEKDGVASGKRKTRQSLGNGKKEEAAAGDDNEKPSVS